MRPRREVSNSESELAFAAAGAICRRHARSFYFASAFLKKPKRDAAYAVYAFCRMIDDAIDQPGEGADCSSDSLESRLGMFRDRLEEIYAKRLELPNPEFRSEEQHALHAFALTVHRYEIPKEYFFDLAEGCRMDLTVSRYATWSALEKYCYHVAGVVGLIMSCVFGLTHSDARRHAVKMGNAMQLTNILRDVKEDWDRGRIYLPLEDMARFRYSERELQQGVVNTAFRELMSFEIDRARKMYHEASEGLCWLAGDGSRLTASAMAVIYAGILGAIERQNYDVFTRRARIGVLRKLGRIPKAMRLARRGPDDPLPKVFG
jgi:15-cis-phytoene synthase